MAISELSGGTELNPSDTPKGLIQVAIFVRKLEVGGAERQALELAKNLPKERFSALIMTFYPGGDFVEEARNAGVLVLSLDKQGRWDLVSFQWRLINLLRRRRINILHAFELPPGLLGLVASPFVSRMRVVWGIRASNLDLNRFDYSRRVVFQISKYLAGLADLVVANSKSGAAYVQSQGFPSRNLSVVSNGIDTQRFAPNRDGVRSLRTEWGVGNEETLIGIVARLDPMKDHTTFLRAAAKYLAAGGKAKFVCVGNGLEQSQLEIEADRLDIVNQLIWAGARNDMPRVYNALDLNSLTSTTEGFPNTLGEAMACGTPCVTTNVGDAAEIVGELGHIAGAGDAEAIAHGWLRLVALSAPQKAELSRNCRIRIRENFSTISMISGNIALYEQLMANDTEKSVSNY